MKALRLCLALAFAAAVVPLQAAATPSGNRWSLAACGTCATGTQCVANVCVPVVRVAASIENNGGMSINGPSGGVPYATFISLVQSTMPAWSTSRVSCNTNWNLLVSTTTFTTPQANAALDGMDHLNNVIWLNGTNWTHLPNELALTTTTYFTSNNEIFDADQEWNNNVLWSTTANGTAYDLESVILHEAGHFLGLNHTTSSASAVMFPTVNPGATKRNLTSLDENDVCTVYPGAAGGQGTSCTSATQCTGGRVCEGRPSGSKICTQDCTGSGACPSGFTCQPSDNGSACLPQIGVPDQCKFCQSGAQCSSSLCLRFDTGVTFCSLNCSDNAQCGPNYTCQLPEGFCVPNAMTCTNQCTTAAECATGYTCTNGTCTPRGMTGDPCTVSLVCQACNICTRESATSDTAFCRVCCGGQGQGGTCNSCANATCGANGVCAMLASGNSSVCVPGSNFPGTCAPCANGMCAEGLQCVGGRCREPCNPAAPGSCQACFDTGSSGVCACSDEIAGVGEPCGNIGGTLSACGTGLACVGSSNAICRTRCDLSVPNSCPTGQVCQMVSGIGVCLPGTEGSVCANCTNTNSCSGTATCYLGRCYEPCNVNLANTCSTCVQSSANGGGVCGCPDQISPANGPCGTMPEVHSCQSGTKCIQGTCRTRCDPMQQNCPIGTTCRDLGNGVFYCQDEIVSGGGGGGGTTGGGGGARGGGSGAATGGGTGGGTMDLGCGCGASGGPVGLIAFGLIGLLRRRRR